MYFLVGWSQGALCNWISHIFLYEVFLEETLLLCICAEAGPALMRASWEFSGHIMDVRRSITKCLPLGDAMMTEELLKQILCIVWHGHIPCLHALCFNKRVLWFCSFKLGKWIWLQKGKSSSIEEKSTYQFGEERLEESLLEVPLGKTPPHTHTCTHTCLHTYSCSRLCT